MRTLYLTYLIVFLLFCGYYLIPTAEEANCQMKRGNECSLCHMDIADN